MTDARERELDAAYLAAISEISAAFYRHDPEEIGITISAPEDEYSDSAERILRECRDALSEGEILDHIRETFKNAHHELARDVFESIRRFQQVVRRSPSN